MNITILALVVIAGIPILVGFGFLFSVSFKKNAKKIFFANLASFA